jgi:hypothetical protein
MLGLLVIGGLVASLVLLPLIVLGWVLRVVFHIILFPFGMLGALVGLGIAGLVLTLVGVVLFVAFGLVAATGALAIFGPLILAALVLWLILRPRRRKSHPTAAA